MMREIDNNFLLSIVVPVYNERDILEPLVSAVRRALDGMSFSGRFEIILVDDGSTDGGSNVMDRLSAQPQTSVRVVHLARNFGHTAAVSAGIEHARGDAVILMDADLQDDPEAIPLFLGHWQDGYDVVYAVRVSRQEHLLSRLAFSCFYHALHWVADVTMPRNAGNFSLMDRRVVDQLRAMPECNAYYPGLRAWIGFRQIGVDVPRLKRLSGPGRVGLRGRWKLAMNAFFSFSYVPLFLFRLMGVVSVGLSMFLIAFALYAKIYGGKDTSVWFSLLVSVSFFGGINLLGIGVLGEYIGRIYDEIRGRPRYIVDRVAEPALTERQVAVSRVDTRTMDISSVGPRSMRSPVIPVFDGSAGIEPAERLPMTHTCDSAGEQPQ